jgi:hypothetical protein
VVASALMGIGVVAGMTAWDTASLSAARAVRSAWANCIVRSELNAALASPWNDTFYAVPSPFDADGTVTVTIVPVTTGRGAPGTPGQEQLLTVQAFDPQSRTLLAQATALKVRALQGRKDLNTQAGVRSDVMLGCPAR